MPLGKPTDMEHRGNAQWKHDKHNFVINNFYKHTKTKLLTRHKNSVATDEFNIIELCMK